jgi:hypothetical protein
MNVFYYAAFFLGNSLSNALVETGFWEKVDSCSLQVDGEFQKE